MSPHCWMISFCTILLGQLTFLAAGLAPLDGTPSHQLDREDFFAAPRSSKITSDVAAFRWEPQDTRSAGAMTFALDSTLQLHQQVLQELVDQQAALLQEQQKLRLKEDALLMDTALLAAKPSPGPKPLDITSNLIYVPPVILMLTMLYGVFTAPTQPIPKQEGVFSFFGKTPDVKSYITPENIASRWFSLLSATLTITAGNCVGSLSFLSGDGGGKWLSALVYTIIMMAAMVFLGAVFFQQKKGLDAASKNEAKDGLLDLTPSEILALTVDEGITSLTAAMSMIIAQVWYNLIPSGTYIVFAGGFVLVVTGEIWQRSLQKGTLAEFLVQSLNGLNIGSVAWFVGLGLSNRAQNYFGAPDGASSKVAWWMWLICVLNSTAVFELINVISTKLSGRDEHGKPYGANIFAMLQGVSMYSSAWILNNILKDRLSKYYIISTCISIIFSSFAVVTVDQFAHHPSSGYAFYADAKNMYLLASKLSSALGQYLAFISGQLASFALAQYFPSESNLRWSLLAAGFQLLALLIEGSRTTWLHSLFKVPQQSHPLSSFFAPQPSAANQTFFAPQASAANQDQRQKEACCC